MLITQQVAMPPLTLLHQSLMVVPMNPWLTQTYVMKMQFLLSLHKPCFHVTVLAAMRVQEA